MAVVGVPLFRRRGGEPHLQEAFNHFGPELPEDWMTASSVRARVNNG